ncbi:MAG: lysophospholipid acyltransferase family protein [Blastocatellia bacterium]|nr:lysophospholipid acyltransferase family protein [Blastocatellia bacterium]
MTTRKQSATIETETETARPSALDSAEKTGGPEERNLYVEPGSAAASEKAARSESDAVKSPQPDGKDAEADKRVPDIHHRLAARRAARTGRRDSIEQLRARVYGRGDLSAYSFRERFVIRAADLLFYFLIRMICSSLRWEVRGGRHLDSIKACGHRAIFTVWHTCIFGAIWFWRKRGIVVMSSQSKDGEYIASFIKRLGYGAARGSSSRGGVRALAIMAECLANGLDVGFTIDGPRGPAFLAKTGAVTLARHTGQAILPFHIAARRHFSLRTWDRMQIPVPFTRAAAFIAEPIYVPRDATIEEIQSKQDALQATLDRLRQEAEDWSDR